MDTHAFALALTRLTQYPIGLQESAVLLLVAAGYTTNRALIDATGSPANHIHSRTNILKRKNLIQSAYSPQGNMAHGLTVKGKRVVTAVLGGGK